MTQVWSATQINSHLSGGGTTTVTYTGTSGAFATVYAGTGVSAGKYYWEAKITATNGTDFTQGSIGFALGNTATTTVGDQLPGFTAGKDTMGSYFVNSGANVEIYVNSTLTAQYPLGFTVANGDVFGFALDLANSRLWYRDITQASGWLGAGTTSDPATNTNGLDLVQDFTILSQPVVPGAILGTNGDALIGFFDPGSWTGTVPAGFASFDALTTPISAKFVGTGGSLAANRSAVRAPSAASFVGSGTLLPKSLTVLQKMAMTFPGSGTFTGDAVVKSRFISAGLLGSGALTATPAIAIRALARYRGSGTFTAVALPTQLSAAFAGAGSLSVPWSIIAAVDPTLYLGSGKYAAAANLASPLVAAFRGTGSLSAAPTLLSAASANFSTAGTFTGVISVPGHTDIAAGFLGAGSLTLSRLSAQIKTSPAFSGSASLTLPRSAASPLNIFSPYRGAGIASANLSVPVQGTVAVNIVDQLGNQIVDQLGNTLATEAQVIQTTFQLEAGFKGQGSLTVARPTLSAATSARFTGTGSFVVARAIAILRGQASFAGAGTYRYAEVTLPQLLVRCFGVRCRDFLPADDIGCPTFSTSNRIGCGTRHQPRHLVERYTTALRHHQRCRSRAFLVNRCRCRKVYASGRSR
jgi:hypothetical protein